jgi:hypothetical protein
MGEGRRQYTSWPVATFAAVLVACGSFLVWYGTRERAHQSETDRIASLESANKKLEERQGASEVRQENSDSLQTWTVVVLSMIADRQGIKNLPPIPLMRPVPRVTSWVAPQPVKTGSDSVMGLIFRLEEARRQEDQPANATGGQR